MSEDLVPSWEGPSLLPRQRATSTYVFCPTCKVEAAVCCSAGGGPGYTIHPKCIHCCPTHKQLWAVRVNRELAVEDGL